MQTIFEELSQDVACECPQRQNSMDPDQTTPLGLHCLSVCRNQSLTLAITCIRRLQQAAFSGACFPSRQRV